MLIIYDLWNSFKYLPSNIDILIFTQGTKFHYIDETVSNIACFIRHINKIFVNMMVILFSEKLKF